MNPTVSPHVYFETDKGTIEIELDVLNAPLTSENFIALVGKGFFEGLPVHRLVPDFVAQAGDPRGDGEGGPGYTIRDELNEEPYLRGTVGMALDWRDTGGSQWFITSTPQPHLDAQYTAFGHVVVCLPFVILTMNARLETFDFPNTWRGLKSVEWTQVSPYHQFDNIRLVRQTPLMSIQKAEHVDAGYSDLGKVYAEAGFRLTKGQNEPYNFACYGTLASNYNGSTSIFNNTVDGLIRLSCVDGGDFDLLQMDLSTLAAGLGDAYIVFTGTKTDGSQVTQGFNVEDAYLTPQTVRFRGFDTLTKVEWTQAYPFHQIDNIVAIEAVYPDSCYPDCDGDGSLTLFDFLCFVNAFNAAQPYANCDGNGSLDLFDFLCYVNAFNAGC